MASIMDEKVWVIKKDGYYVNPKFRSLFTGHASGFAGYTSEVTANKELELLGGIKEGYCLEYIWYRDIPDGERIRV